MSARLRLQNAEDLIERAKTVIEQGIDGELDQDAARDLLSRIRCHEAIYKTPDEPV